MRTRVLSVALALAVAAAAEAQTLSGQVHLVTVTRGETLRSLSSRYGVDPATIARDNDRTVAAPLAVGAALRIDNRHIVPSFPAGAAVVVNVPQRMVFAMSPDGVAAYPAAVGSAGWATPLGEFSVVSKETNPTWDVPESIREEARRAGRALPLKVPPGPSNPLGAYWIGLSLGSVGIHGTNAPTSIYQAGTHGCIRLRPDDIAALFGQVQLRATGVALYQPVLVAAVGDGVFVEAHRDVYRQGPADALEFVRARTRELGVFDRVDWTLAIQVIRERAGVARLVSR